MDTPAAVKMNRTNTAGTDIAWGAYLGIAMIGADISDNSCTGGGCENEPRSCPHCNDGKPVYGDPDAGAPPPLVVGGANRQLFVSKDVRVSGNIGFQGSTGALYANQPLSGHSYANPWPGAGWLRLLGDDVAPWWWSTSADATAELDLARPLPPVNRTAMRGCMDYHTWTADRVRVRNLIHSDALLGGNQLGTEVATAGREAIDTSNSAVERQLQPADPNGPTPTLFRTNRTVDSDAIYEWRQASKYRSASLLLGELDLASNPSVLNHSVFFALGEQANHRASN